MTDPQRIPWHKQPCNLTWGHVAALLAFYWLLRLIDEVVKRQWI